MFEDPEVSRVQVYVRIRPLVQGDVRSIDGKGAVGVKDADPTQVRGRDLLFCENKRVPSIRKIEFDCCWQIPKVITTKVKCKTVRND